MPTLPTLASLFNPADVARLQGTIANAKQAGVSVEVILAAETQLESLKTKEQKEAAAKAKKDLRLKRERAEFELKSAMPTLSTLFLPADTARLQSAIDAAKEASVSSEIIAAGEVTLQELSNLERYVKRQEHVPNPGFRAYPRSYHYA